MAGKNKPGENSPGQGKAVQDALDGDRNQDTDRWDGFSEKEAGKRGAEPAPPPGAEKPRAGLARKGKVIEGE